MNAINPYAPPRAAVDDVIEDDGAVQPVKTWSAAGRIGRLRYMAHLVAAYLLLIALSFVGGFAAAMTHGGSGDVVAWLAIAVYFVFMVLKSIQRSHDMDWSGWSAILALIPLVGLIWVFKAGTPGSNRFGPPAPPNTTGVRILGLYVPLLGVVAIVLGIAVAIPAYNSYVNRVKAAQPAH